MEFEAKTFFNLKIKTYILKKLIHKDINCQSWDFKLILNSVQTINYGRYFYDCPIKRNWESGEADTYTNENEPKLGVIN